MADLSFSVLADNKTTKTFEAVAAQIDRLSERLNKLGRSRADIQVNADIAKAQAKLDEVKRKADEVGRARETIKVKADTKEAESGLARMKAAAKDAGGGMSGLLAAGLALGPALIPVLGVVAAGTVAMGGALVGAGVAAGAFAAVVIPTMSRISDLNTKQEAMNTAIGVYGKNSKQATTATKKYQYALSQMAPAELTLRSALAKGSQAFKDWQKAMVPTVIPIFTQAVGLIKPALAGVKAVLDGAMPGIRGFMDTISGFVKSKWFQTMSIDIGNIAREALPIFGSAFVNAAKGIGNLIVAFRPITTIVLNGLQSMMTKFAQWSNSLKTNQGFQNFITYVKENAPKVMALFGSIVGAIGKIVQAVAPIGAVVMPVLTFLFNTIRNMPTPLVTALAIAIGVVTAALWAMSLTPIVLVIIGIVAAVVAVVAVIQHWGTIWNWLKGIILAVVGWMMSFLQGAWNIIKAGFTTVWNAIKSVFSTVWNGIKNVATTVWNAISGFFVRAFNAYKAAFQMIWNTVKSVFSTVWNGIKSVATTVWNAISGFFSRAFNAYKVAFTLIWNVIKSVFSTVWNWIKNTAVSVWNAISSFFSRAFAAYKATFTLIWNVIKSVFSTVWNAIKGTATTVWNAISGFFSRAFNTFKSLFGRIWDSIVAKFKSAWDGIKKAAQSIWDGISTVFKKGVNGIIDAINWMTDKINKVTGIFGIPKIPPIARLAQGGTLTVSHDVPALAKGGSIGGGFTTNGPMAIVGEGRKQYPEYVVPTDPQYRKRALGLHAALGSQLGAGGMPMMASGGVLGWLGDRWNDVKHVAGSVWGGLKDAAQWIGGSVKNIYGHIKGSIEGMLPQGMFRNLGGGLIKKIIQGAIDKATSFGGGGGIGDISGIIASGGSQLAMAKVIGQVGKRMGFNHQGIVVALMTALQESGLRNLNYGDRDSLGLFQQRPSQGWGSPAQILNPAYAAAKFFQALGGVGGWQGMAPTVAAQRVQRSAFPGAYAKWQGAAEMLAKAGGFDSGGIAGGKGFMPKDTLKPERVLSPQQTESFDRLVDALTSGGVGAGVNNTFHVQTYAGQSPEEIAAELRRRQLLAMR